MRRGGERGEQRSRVTPGWREAGRNAKGRLQTMSSHACFKRPLLMLNVTKETLYLFFLLVSPPIVVYNTYVHSLKKCFLCVG